MDSAPIRSTKEHWSNWHITINFNKPGGRDEIREFKECLDSILGDLHWQWLMRFDNGNRRPFTPLEHDLVNTIKATIGFERGPANGFLHAHVILEVGHWTMLQLDGKEIQRMVDVNCGVSSNVQFRFLPGDSNSVAYIHKYITKTIREKPDPDQHHGPNKRLVRVMQGDYATHEEEEYDL